MQSTVHVVLYGRDIRLLETRALILKGVGFDVAITASEAGAMELLDGPAATVMVVCHTLRKEERERILAAAHALPQATSLILEGGSAGEAAGMGDEVLRQHLGPQGLVASVRRLVERVGAVVG